MQNLNFLRQLTGQKEPVVKTKKLTDDIEYDQYIVTMVNERKKKIFIPKREAKLFEDALVNVPIVTESEVKKLLRKFNGVTNI